MKKSREGCCDGLKLLGGDDSAYSEDKGIFKEKGKELRLQKIRGKKNYCFVHIEKIISNAENQKKQDCLVKICDDNLYYFIELKGNGISVKEALDQIIATIKYVENKTQQRFRKDQIIGVIIGGKVPSGPRWNNLKNDFLKNFGRKLIRKDRYYEII